MSSYVRRLALVLTLTIISIGVGALVSQQGGRVPLHPDQIALTAGISDFTWSPDGKNLAYVSTQSGSSDIWISPSAGGAARRLTSIAVLKLQPRWSPDGKWIAFVGIQPGGAGDLMLAGAGDQTVTNLTESPDIDDRNPVWSPDSADIAFTRRFGNRTHTSVINLGSKSVRTLVEAAASEMAWSPDGKSLLYVSDPLLTNDDRRENDDIFVIAAAGGTPRLLTPGTPRFRDFNPSWSPDSRQIAFASETSGASNIYILDTQSGVKRTLTTGQTEQFSPKWSPDGSSIIYLKNEEARLSIWMNVLQGGRVSKISDRDGTNGGYELPDSSPRGKIEWSPDGKRIAFTHSDPAKASDLWVTGADGSRSMQLTNSMPAELRREGRFVWPELSMYRSFDGEEISALIYKPRGVKPKSGHPALLVFRDALDGQHVMNWDPLIQFFVSDGYLVFAPNIRGSRGRGREFRQLLYEHGGDHDVRDAFIGLDRLSSEGLIDGQRVGVFGAGTGGFLTTASLIKDETRFKAAVSLYGIVDAVTASAYPGMGVWTRYMIGESPMASPLPFYERSLVNFVDKLRTPIIFLNAGDDPRAPFQQLQQFAVQAEVKGKWFDHRTFENESEGWRSWRPNNLRQALEAMDALFEKHLLGRDREIRLSRDR